MNAWRRVKPFREVDTPVVHFLKRVPSAIGSCNACDKSFRDLVRGALVTGCRYGELTRMQAADFNAEAGTITVRVSKVRQAPPRRVERRRSEPILHADSRPLAAGT